MTVIESRTAAAPLTADALTGALLKEQAELTAVNRFAQWHEALLPGETTGFYRRLIPLTRPQPGQQYAFEVDLDKCSGCKACVSACHSLNGLDDGEIWRGTGSLVSDDWRHPYQQTITTACHHCVEPACLDGCPVLAYDKDPATGIVRHLDDQCIGCQYCVLKCPYEVPTYSPSRGIVRKCDMCSSRLNAGEAPACVQACPNESIRISLVDKSAVASQFRPPLMAGVTAPKAGTGAGVAHEPLTKTVPENPFLPNSPAPDYTLPTTRYKSVRPMPDGARAADREELQPQPAHWPLVYMLILSQFATGLYLCRLGLDLFFPSSQAVFGRAQALAALAAGVAALGVGALHLGRPWGAWRAFLGLRKSWLSRELVAFSLFLPVAAAYTVSVWFNPAVLARYQIPLGVTTVALGLAGVFCSAMVYHDTRRDFWRLPLAGGKFFGSTLLLGSSGTLLLLALSDPAHLAGWKPAPHWSGAWHRLAVGNQWSFRGAGLVLLAIVVIMSLLKLSLDQRVVQRLADDDFSPLHKTALLLTDHFGAVRRCQIVCLVLGGLGLPLVMALGLNETGVPIVSPAHYSALAWLMFLAALGAELVERHLFFLTVQPVKMPGSMSS